MRRGPAAASYRRLLGKGTQVRPSADIDIMVEFAPAVFQRFEARVGNRQSQLLQEVKLRLSDSYPQTGMRGDGWLSSWDLTP